ncbi:cell division protein FtsK [Carnobacterium divergens]|uniref:cell division protein FtsK n=1 Tax=Carnobacterium divergens TaxID=2748 RepID=UPI000E73BB6F|nr:cell division protein FtsK [Carnobacterium divergens]AOA00709.1 cell division protein FtsK [Carnobacterium divergens]
MNNTINLTCPAQLDKFLLQNLNNALDINGETSYTNSFLIRLSKNDLGFFFIPNLPVSYALDSNLYFQVASIASGILYPYKTLLLQNNAYFVPFNIDDPNTARALFFPWVDGIPTRLIIDNIEQFIKEKVNQQNIPVMEHGVSINMDDVVHLAVSGSSGSGKSVFVEYLIRLIHSFTDEIVLIDPKMADIYILGKELNLEVHAPYRGSNLNSFITEVNEVLGQVIDKIYQRQQCLLDNHTTKFAKCYIVIDELLALVQGSSKQARDTFAQLLGTIALLGRATNVSLILVSQRFDAVAFGGNTAVREQINCSIILGEINTNTTQFLLPNAPIDNIVVPNGVGTGIIKFNDGKHNHQIMPLLTPTYRKVGSCS